jgi:membrane-anchored protein YejM (alkaline phosphatase superfamily)
MNHDEFIKEALKAKFEFLKIYALFLVGLSTAVGGMILNENYNKGSVHVFILATGVVILIFVAIYFLALTIQIRRSLKQLNKK